MSERKPVYKYIDIDDGNGGNLFDKIKRAWLQVPEEYQQDADLSDDCIHYERPETDDEMNARIQKEMEQIKIEKQKRENLVVTDLHNSVNTMLINVHNNWDALSTGNETTMTASVPMPDDRTASIKITVTAREQVKNAE